jgi:hypothetical protein
VKGAGQVLARILARPRNALTTLLEVAGFAVIDAGIWQINANAGLIAVGSSLIAVGVLEG